MKQAARLVGLTRQAITRHCITGGEVYVVGMEASLTKQGGMLVMTELVEGWLVAVNLVAFAVYGIDKYKSMPLSADTSVINTESISRNLIFLMS